MNGRIASFSRGATSVLLVAAALAGVAACGNQEATHAAVVQQVRQEAERKVQEVERQRLEAEKAQARDKTESDQK